MLCGGVMLLSSGDLSMGYDMAGPRLPVQLKKASAKPRGRERILRLRFDKPEAPLSLVLAGRPKTYRL
jgi:hypothetical protein